MVSASAGLRALAGGGWRIASIAKSAAMPSIPEAGISSRPMARAVSMPACCFLPSSASCRPDARGLHRRLLGLCNDVGLLSEEYDPRARRFLGNFPQAFSHVAVVNSALGLMRAGGPPPRKISKRQSAPVARHD